MKSPFPGMDPFIEACGLWEDFHAHLVEHISEALTDQVPDRYLVRTGERSYVVLIQTEGKSTRPFLPDVSVTSPAGRKQTRGKGGAAIAEKALPGKPVAMRAFVEEEHRETFVEIYEANPERRLVTCIEVLSPSNKRPGSQGWELYQRKRQSLLLGEVNLVEIDLVREGQRMPMLDPWPKSPYTVLVARARKAQLCKVWQVHFQHPIPPIPIPLANSDPAVQLRIQPMIDVIYRRYRYERSIDYSKPLSPPLDAEVAAWLARRRRSRTRPLD